MYTDWTAVILLLLTAIPLGVVVATAAFFIWRQKNSSSADVVGGNSMIGKAALAQTIETSPEAVSAQPQNPAATAMVAAPEGGLFGTPH